MSTLHEKLTNLSEKQDGLVQNKVAKFCYTDRAYTNDLVDSEPDFDINRDNNIPTPDPTTLRVNETILSRGWRAQASSITRMLMNHFLGRMSYNLNKVNDHMKTLLTTFDESLGTADGIATLDSNAHVPSSQIMKGESNGVASLDSSTKLPVEQLPSTAPLTVNGVAVSENHNIQLGNGADAVFSLSGDVLTITLNS